MDAKPTNVTALVTAFLFFIIGMPSTAQENAESTIVTDEDALFGEEDDSLGETPEVSSMDSLFDSEDTPLIEEVTPSAGIASSLLTSENVELGGRYGFSTASSWTWIPSDIADDFTSPESESILVDLSATLFFDARPVEEFRVFGKTSVLFPFDNQTGTRDFDDVFHIEELFSDFTWRDLVFFRGGKHTINWGVGYFFSPADLLNITEIDPEDPEADREGPVSLKTHVPIGVHNFYLFLIANDVETADELGIAAKAEFLLGPAEIGIGGLYQKDVAPSGMLTVSLPLWDIDFFGEAVLRYGSDKTFVEESDTDLLGVTAVSYGEELFFHATAGLSFRYSFDEVDSSVSFFGQYLYNGEGYSDPAILQNNQPGIGALLGAGDLTVADLMSPGVHYVAVNAGWNGIFGSDFTLQAFWTQNFTDMSGYVSPAVSVDIIDYISLRVSVRYQFGEEGDEFSPIDDRVTAQIAVALGAGSF